MKFLITESRLRNAAREAFHCHQRLCSTRKELVDLEGVVRRTLDFQNRFIGLFQKAQVTEHLSENALEKVVFGVFGRSLNEQIDLALVA